MPTEQWDDLTETWRRTLGQFERFALIVRRQHSRTGFALLLLHAGRSVAFVKVRDEASPLVREERALAALQERPAPSVKAPAPLASGTSESWTWLATSPMTSRPHVPEDNAPVDDVVAELQERLSGLPRPPDTPVHWTPMHGDLTPWNLRSSSGQRWLLDWEDAGYGPPGADALYYRVTCASVRIEAPPLTTVSDETVAFWKSTLEQRRESAADAELSAFLVNQMREHVR